METRYGVARSEQTAFDPVRSRHKADAVLSQPDADVVMAALHIGLRPGAGPAVVLVEFAKSVPVGQRQFGRVANARSPLLRCADEKDAAKTFLRQTAEVVGRIALQQQHTASGVEQFQRSADTCNAAADDDDFAHALISSFCSRSLARNHAAPNRADGRAHSGSSQESALVIRWHRIEFPENREMANTHGTR